MSLFLSFSNHSLILINSSGHSFAVIQSSDGPRNEIVPPLRDVVVTGGSFDNSVTIRFFTDNPGASLLIYFIIFAYAVWIRDLVFQQPERLAIGYVTCYATIHHGTL